MPNEQKVTRKLRAIISADVKGYSLLMADDEAHTIQTLKIYRILMANLIQQHSGRVVDNPGDNLLAEFSSAVDAVECAVEIQKKLKNENAKFVEDKRLQFRIGVNIGDVVHDDGRIYGSGINVAARIEGIADPGGICISRNTYDQVKDKIDIGFGYLGEHDVKNIKEPVRVYKILLNSNTSKNKNVTTRKRRPLRWLTLIIVVVILLIIGALGGIYWKYFYIPNPSNISQEENMSLSLPKGPSIAVLPLTNMTGDPEQEYLCDGITENIISGLCYVPELLVIARNSTFIYKNKPITAQQIGLDLGAQYFIEGSIQKSLDRIRITIQLIETNSGHHIWSEVFDRELEDLFRLQDEITLSILKSINLELKGGDRISGYNEGFTSLKEYFKFLRSWYHFNQLSPEQNKIAQKGFRELITVNNQIPIVYSLLANTYILDLWNGSCETPILCIGKATEATQNALSLNENDFSALNATGHILFMRQEHEKATAYVKRAIALNSSCADCYILLGFILNVTGQPHESISFIDKALILNPMPPNWYYIVQGITFANTGNPKKAITSFEKSINVEPSWMAYLNLAKAYADLGNESNAKMAGSELLKLRPEFSIEGFIDIVPFVNHSQKTSYKDALLKAGLPK